MPGYVARFIMTVSITLPRASIDMATGENEYQEDEPLEYDIEAISKGKQMGRRLGIVSQSSWKVGDARQRGDLW
jgi:hypothetical protein